MTPRPRSAGSADWEHAHHWLAVAVGDGLSVGDDASLYYGAPAAAFALHPADHPGYGSARAVADASVQAVTRRRLQRAHHRLDRGERPALTEYDLISGLTGLGAHLWRHDPGSDLVTDVLAYLVRLTEPLDGLPGWWTLSTPGRTVTFPPGGHSNHGLAHGVTGPLALFGIVARGGLVVDGQIEAIDRICSWLDAWEQHHHLGPWWPETVSLEDVKRGRPAQDKPLRPSWCYGTPGIARAQQLAALATSDRSRQTTAETAVIGCLSDPHQTGLIIDRGLCHGTAGLYMTVASIAGDAIGPVPDTADLLLNHPAPVDEPTGFLTGTAGYALALHALATGKPPTTGWDACLLLR